MSIHLFNDDVAAEQRRALISSADDYRMAMAAHPRRASRLNLRIRPIRPTDEARLAEVFAGLSAESRQARFLHPKTELTPAELRYFSDVDHHDHEALISLTRIGREPVAVARFIRDATDPLTADVALVVVDAWQNRGAGSLLAARLAHRAQQEGIHHFTALTASDNVRARRLLAKIGQVSVVARDAGTVSYRVALNGPAPSTPRHRPTSLATAGA